MNDMSGRFTRFADIRVDLAVELGRTRIPLRELQQLTEGSVVALDRMTDELLDLTANGHPIAKCEVVAQNGRFALRIVSLESAEAPVGQVGGIDAPEPSDLAAAFDDAPTNRPAQDGGAEAQAEAKAETEAEG